MYYRITGITASKIARPSGIASNAQEFPKNSQELPQIDNHRKNNGGRMSRRFSFDGKILIVDGGRLKKQSAWPLGVQERRNDK